LATDGSTGSPVSGARWTTGVGVGDGVGAAEAVGEGGVPWLGAALGLAGGWLVGSGEGVACATCDGAAAPVASDET
jgi:hypothetical protein